MIKPSEVIKANDNVCEVLIDDSPVDSMWGIGSVRIDLAGIVALLQGKCLYFDDGEYAHILYYDKGEG